MCNLHGDFLTIDHINGGGSKLRRSENLYGLKFYRWIKNNNFPDSLRILCFNCNIKTSIGSVSKISKFIKSDVVQHYGNSRCLCCGINDIDVLAIDHINGQGAFDRDKYGGGVKFYKVLMRNYPAGYQVLCFNCNFSKHLNGKCIHQLNILNN